MGPLGSSSCTPSSEEESRTITWASSCPSTRNLPILPSYPRRSCTPAAPDSFLPAIAAHEHICERRTPHLPRVRSPLLLKKYTSTSSPTLTTHGTTPSSSIGAPAHAGTTFCPRSPTCLQSCNSS